MDNRRLGLCWDEKNDTPYIYLSLLSLSIS